MVWLVGALLALWWAWGPVVPVLVVGALCVPRLRWWVQDRITPGPRVRTGILGAVGVAAAVFLLVPDGWLPLPAAPGAWAGPSYVGRPASLQPVVDEGAPKNPHRAVGDARLRPGPLGLQPEVATAWWGLSRCGRLELTSTDQMFGLCTDRGGPSLRWIDTESLRPGATLDLPDLPDGPGCAHDAWFVDDADRVVVATADRRVLAVRTDVGDGATALATDQTWDLRPYVPFGDCLVGLAPDWSGRLWWTSQQGLVGTITPEAPTDAGQVRVLDLDEAVSRGLAVDRGGAYVVTDSALHRLTAGADGAPQVDWRTAYDGSSGSAPVLLGGAVAITDSAEGRMGVLFVARDSGRPICRQPVFGPEDGSTDSPLAALGTGVVVTNNHGYSSPRSTMLGFTSSHGIARVDLVDGACVERWTSDAVSPSSGVTASEPSGLVYAWTKRPSLAGVSAWYLTGLDARTGRSMWSVRTGTGLLAGSDHSQITIGPDSSAWIGTLAGLVRVRDRS